MPFCPACRSEFRQGFDRCAECDVSLVNELPFEPPALPPTNPSRVTVYQSTQHSDALILCSLLKGNGIPASIENQNTSMWLIGMPTPAIPLEVSVPTPDAPDAREIVKEVFPARPSVGLASKSTHRLWLIGLALMVPALADGSLFLGGSRAFAAAGAWAALAAGLILDLRDRRSGTIFSEARICLFFLVGAAAAVTTAEILYPWLLKSTDMRVLSAGHAFAIVGPVEEMAKFLPAFLILTLKPEWRADPLAWVLAAAAAGAGFGFVENLGKFTRGSPDAAASLVASSAGLLHPYLSGMVGYGVALAATRDGRIMAALGGLILAAFIHGAWDALALEGQGWICLGLLGVAAWIYFRKIDRAVGRIVFRAA